MNNSEQSIQPEREGSLPNLPYKEPEESPEGKLPLVEERDSSTIARLRQYFSQLSQLTGKVEVEETSLNRKGKELTVSTKVIQLKSNFKLLQYESFRDLLTESFQEITVKESFTPNGKELSVEYHGFSGNRPGIVTRDKSFQEVAGTVIDFLIQQQREYAELMTVVLNDSFQESDSA